ncbi:hypothetical protein PFICI_05349 [Pestalotiopsis fici W106-1]|uniref:RING-type domain-containing protein n=1 Tax=Pestalotiopsis fici (strain W106-1 / CGMCC3.15140) TaxID=1229662 RepID=W3XBL2_PESFW|nr:uncharacterized protein PFICI_05349 [Pestalotiopsis fici W106-1]ETS83473.1 hypothetical protein PFICI_05349 [Pestalotiopsis fici W106-1]
MDSPRPGVDLEKELTCSICTEVLYQPLTLLDCLHTFCGSCLKDWFSWQATIAENSPDPPPAGTNVATCPSCRAPVRDTRHNATVATLLDMFLAANPDKARSEEDKLEMHEKYQPGVDVLPKVSTVEKSPEEQRLEELESQMLAQAREMSLRASGVGAPASPRPQQHRHRREHQIRHLDSSDRSDRDSSRDSRHRDARHRTRREGERRQRAVSESTLQPSEEGRHRRSESQQRRSRDPSRTRRARPIEHQSSIRSLISSSSIDSLDMEREIEEFARQIQEEGLLDGLDLDNLDITQNDELSKRITEAYRRRQTQRTRQDTSRRTTTSSRSSRADTAPLGQRPLVVDRSRASSRQRANSENTRNSNSASQLENRTRRPPITATHLDVRDGPERRRRRTSSGARSATEPTVRSWAGETQPAARSQTDLTLRARASDAEVRRPSAGDRSSSLPTAAMRDQVPVGLGLSFGERTISSTQLSSSVTIDTSVADHGSPNTRQRPPSVVVSPQNPLPSLGAPMSPIGHHRTRSHFYHEPSITCSRCGKGHIEYDLHYNCARCRGGEWNICLDCYRAGKGCLHWFGFGYSAFKKWERARANGNPDLEDPHMLTSSRYIAPKIIPGGAEGRRTMTTDDPLRRLQSGMFCAGCLAWTNECYWRCEECNDGDWGFCNRCVNEGRSCTHPLLPLTWVSPSNGPSPPPSPRIPNPPAAASLYKGPQAMTLGNFRPLSFRTACSVCRASLEPSQSRCHCYTCPSPVMSASSTVAEAQPGEYEVCMDCYRKLESDRLISAENGLLGWRRCLNGHRMVIINYQVAGGGERRNIVHDLVGGWDFHMQPLTPTLSAQPIPGLMKWSWPGPNGTKCERLVTDVVGTTAPITGPWTEAFPPEGGSGLRATAHWAWYPGTGATDELMFPKGAEILEIEDVNGEWFFGCYMGAKGLFPAPYVRVIATQ